MTDAKPAWLDAHSHEPNPETPEGNGAFRFKAGEIDVLIDLDLLRAIRYTELAECTIASTGHAQTGPFRFGGVLVRDLLAALLPAKAAVIHVDFVGADGYGTRLQGSQLLSVPGPLVAFTIDGAPLRREQGLVRLIVPGEADDALHQVKWLERIDVSLVATD